MTELKRQTQRFQTALEWLEARADAPDAADSSSRSSEPDRTDMLDQSSVPRTASRPSDRPNPPVDLGR